MTKQSLSPADIDDYFASAPEFAAPTGTPHYPTTRAVSVGTRRRIHRVNFGQPEYLEVRQLLSGVAAEVSIENDLAGAAAALQQAEQYLTDATAAVSRDASSLAAAQAALNSAQAQLTQAQQAPAESSTVTQAIRATATGAQEYASPDYAEGHNSSSGRQLGWMIFGQQYHAPTGRFYTWRSGLTFDTTNIPDDAVITDAKLKIVPYDKNDVSNRKPQAVLVPLSSGVTALGSVGYDALTLNTVNVLTLNNAGKSAINKTGPTALGLRTDQEIAGEAPRTDGNNLYFFQVRGTESPDEQPILEVTYTATSRSGVTIAEHSLQSAQDTVNARNASLTASHIAQAAARNVRDAAKNILDTLTIQTTLAQANVQNITVEREALRTQLVDGLTAALTETFAAEQAAEAEQVKYPKLFVTADTSMQDRIVFTVRYRTPDPNTEIVGRVFQNGTYVDFTSTQVTSGSGVPDATWRPSYNRGNGQVFFIMRDRTTGAVLDQVSFFCPDNREARLETPQLPFEQEEQGRLSENPITPDLKVVGIQGPNVLVSYQTPSDTAQVHIDGGGMLSWQTITQGGGTNFSLGRVTFNVARPAGTYNLILTDTHGLVQKSLPVSWDGTSLHLINGNDQLQGNNAMIQNNQTALDFRNTGLLPNIDIDDPVIRTIQQSNLYIATGTLPSNLNFYYPTDRIMAVYNRMSPRPSLDTLNSNFQVYGAAIGDIVKASLEVFIGIEQGKNEINLRQQLQTVITGNANKPAIQYLRQDGVGVNFPDMGASLEIGKILFRTEWQRLMQTRSDVTQYRGYVQDQWEILNRDDRREREVEKKIALLKHSQDPRIQNIDDATKKKLATAMAAGNPQDAIVAAATSMMDLGIERVQDILHPIAELHLRGNVDRSIGIDMLSSGNRTIPLVVEEDSMVNLWTDGMRDRDVTFTINGGAIPKDTYVSHKGMQSGNSVSLRLTQGAYTLTIKDQTPYGTLYQGHLLEATNFTVPLQVSSKPFMSQKIEGKVSLEGNDQVMPVSMSVAEYRADGKRKVLGVDAINALDPNKPIWVIAPGRGDNESSDAIAELARNLQAYDGIQVVTINWSQGAADNTTPIGLQGSKWIEAVGSWTAHQLQAIGFVGQHLNNVNLVGHSWGAYVCYEIGEHLGSKINTMVALDPAADNKFLGGKYDISQVDFSRFATSSYAFHSSMFGDREKALTAQYSFKIEAPENYESGNLDTAATLALMRQHYLTALGIEIVDEANDAYREHGFAVTLFASLLHDAKGSSGNIASYFTPQNISQSSPSFSTRNDNYEGVFTVSPIKSQFTQGTDAGKDWWKAGLYHFYSQDTIGKELKY